MVHKPRKVGFLPYGFKLGLNPARFALDRLYWPLGVPDDIAGKTLSDLTSEDHLILSPRNSYHIRPSFGTAAKISLLFGEPRAVHKRHMQMLRLTHRRFHRILTADPLLLSQIPNALFFPVGNSWVDDWASVDLTKTAMCSLIASGRRELEGHKLRHMVVDWLRGTDLPVDIMGRGYRPFAKKSDGLAAYRYSVVIENVREVNYFTEKLIDALLCNTVPIYWGCPNIADFFDTRAIIVCESLADIQRAIPMMSEQDYATRLPILQQQRAVAQGYSDFVKRAAQLLLADKGLRS